MGRYCRICGRVRANERFTGRGHRHQICKDCQRRPHGEREQIEQLDELYRFLGQSNISAKNVARLTVLCGSADEKLRQLAALILDIARVHPRKRHRLKFLAGQRRDLFARMHTLLGDEYFDEFIPDCGPDNDWLHDALAAVGGKSSPVQSVPRFVSPDSDDSSKSVRHELQTGGLKRVTIHTDGACEGNPGPGGWATTNNRMELRAAIAALRALKESCRVELFTDSEYLRDGIMKWLVRWKVNGWRTIERKPVKNDDLWRQLDALCLKHQVHWHWLKGHAGHPDNERCDQLANAEITKIHKQYTAIQLASLLREFKAGRSPGENQGNLPD